jgi:hypothetical protein
MKATMADPNSEAVSRELATVCAYCGGPIDTTVRRKHRTRKFCCDEHRWAWHRDRRLALHEELRRLVELVGPDR